MCIGISSGGMSITTISPVATGEPVVFGAGLALAATVAVLVILIVKYNLITLKGSSGCRAISS